MSRRTRSALLLAMAATVVTACATPAPPPPPVPPLPGQTSDSALPDWMAEMSDLDRLLALWEWRTGPTPWLWMEKL